MLKGKMSLILCVVLIISLSAIGCTGLGQKKDQANDKAGLQIYSMSTGLGSVSNNNIDLHRLTYTINLSNENTEDHWQVLYRAGFYRGGPILMSAIAGIDQALWDIKGKYYNAPIYQLIGGACRDKIRVYCWIGGDRPQDVGAQAKEKQEQGYTAIKMNGTEELHYIDSYSKIDEAVARVAAIRETCGKDFGIAVDFHGRVHKAMAKILVKELESYRLMFIEEPVLAENIEALKENQALSHSYSNGRKDVFAVGF
ncbi:MAG: hypothetical protein JM58_15580 [Peptococcaceae bacterium BICA1-8]|nr:MAG: hypothetical protein JM58_15580 [Peptococcaceae bacterium BICA1-8]